MSALKNRRPQTEATATIRNFGAGLRPTDFELFEKLGQGSFGAVWLGQHVVNKLVCAIKAISTEISEMKGIQKEIEMMRGLYSPYIIQYYGSVSNGNELWILMEYCPGGSTRDLMKALKEPLTEPEIASVMKSVFRGLEYLHSRQKIHRDIKAGNIMLDSSGDAKIGDFGISENLTAMKHSTIIGTPFWMAPEVILGEGYDEKCDIWSAGITILELAEMRPPNHSLHPMRAIFKIPTSVSPMLKKPEMYAKTTIQFLERCLSKEPEKRPSASEALEDAFLVNAPPPSLLKQRIDRVASLIASVGRSDAIGESDDDISTNDNPDQEEMDEMIRQQEEFKAKRAQNKQMFPASNELGIPYDEPPPAYKEPDDSEKEEEMKKRMIRQQRHFCSESSDVQSDDESVRPFIQQQDFNKYIPQQGIPSPALTPNNNQPQNQSLDVKFPPPPRRPPALRTKSTCTFSNLNNNQNPPHISDSFENDQNKSQISRSTEQPLEVQNTFLENELRESSSSVQVPNSLSESNSSLSTPKQTPSSRVDFFTQNNSNAQQSPLEQQQIGQQFGNQFLHAGLPVLTAHSLRKNINLCETPTKTADESCAKLTELLSLDMNSIVNDETNWRNAVQNEIMRIKDEHDSFTLRIARAEENSALLEDKMRKMQESYYQKSHEVKLRQQVNALQRQSNLLHTRVRAMENVITSNNIQFDLENAIREYQQKNTSQNKNTNNGFSWTKAIKY